MNCSTPGLPVHHQLLEFTQTLVHWVGDAIQPSHAVIPFSFRLQSFPASGSFQMSQFFSLGGQRIGVSASVSVLSMNTQDWSPLEASWISLQSKGLKSLLQHNSSKASILWHSAFFIVQLSHPYMITGKTIALTRWTFVGKEMSLLFNMLSRLVITFLPRSKRHFNFMAAVTICSDFGAPNNKVSHCFHCFPIYFPWGNGTRCHDISFWMLRFKPTFSLSSFTFIKRLFSSSLSAIRVVSSAYLRLLIFLPQSWFQLVLHPAQRFSWCTLHIS